MKKHKTLTPNNTDYFGSDLSLLSVSVTVKKCDCNFWSKLKCIEFQSKIQWAILKFSKIPEC